MDDTKLEELEKAYKKEKDYKIRIRMVTVRMVRVRNMSVNETADIQGRRPNWVRNWLCRFDDGGLKGLRDLPRCGRPRRIPLDIIDGIIAKVSSRRITPLELQQSIRKDTGVKLHITYVRKIMHRHNLSPKAPRKIHVNRADKKAVQNWKYRFNRRVSRLEKDGFTVLMEDEAIFIHDVIVGRKYWSPVGHSISVPYTGSHRRIVTYGSITRDGRQFFRTYEKFDGPTFVQYLKDLHRHFGKVAVTADRAPQHRSKLVREFLRNNKDVKMIYLPKGSPYLNAMEECWHQGKRVLLVSEYYKTFQDMRQAVSLYYRTVRFNLDLIKFASRKYETLCTNF